MNACQAVATPLRMQTQTGFPKGEKMGELLKLSGIAIILIQASAARLLLNWNEMITEFLSVEGYERFPIERPKPLR